MAAGAGNGGRRGSGIEDNDLPLANHAHRGGGNARFFPPVQAFLFLQRPVIQRPDLQGQRPAMGALQLALMMEVLEVFPDGDERGAKTLGQVAHQHPAIVLQQFQDIAAALFTQHGLFLIYALRVCPSRKFPSRRRMHKYSMTSRIFPRISSPG